MNTGRKFKDAVATVIKNLAQHYRAPTLWNTRPDPPADPQAFVRFLQHVKDTRRTRDEGMLEM